MFTRLVAVVQYRGPCPLEHTLRNGDTSTGVSVLRMNTAAFDAGEVVDAQRCDVAAEDNVHTYASIGVSWL
jgi:methionyl-tRNA formyltransferase